MDHDGVLLAFFGLCKLQDLESFGWLRSLCFHQGFPWICWGAQNASPPPDPQLQGGHCMLCLQHNIHTSCSLQTTDSGKTISILMRKPTEKWVEIIKNSGKMMLKILYEPWFCSTGLPYVFVMPSTVDYRGRPLLVSWLPMTTIGCFLCMGIHYCKHCYVRHTGDITVAHLKQSFSSEQWLHESFYVLILQPMLALSLRLLMLFQLYKCSKPLVPCLNIPEWQERNVQINVSK